jgi:hypothetical protein
MKTKAIFVAALAVAAQLQTVSLRASLKTGGLEVDVEKGIIKNAAVISIGEAEGHNFWVDATTLEQVASLINANKDGVKIRFKHPDMTPVDGGVTIEDDIGTVVGRLKNARVEGQSVRGDIYLGAYAESLPGLGDVRSYLLGIAKDDPEAIGLSAVIGIEEFEPVGGKDVNRVVARVGIVDAVDFVGRPAANPRGLLSAKPKLPAFKSLRGKPKFRSLCGGCDYPVMRRYIGIGERVTVKAGMEHVTDDAGKSASIVAMGGTAYALMFDGSDEISRWYTEGELQLEPLVAVVADLAAATFRSRKPAFKSLKK